MEEQFGLGIWFMNSKHVKAKNISDSQREPGDTSPMQTMLNTFSIALPSKLQEEPKDSPGFSRIPRT
jgi:hypothetical protein